MKLHRDVLLRDALVLTLASSVFLAGCNNSGQVNVSAASDNPPTDTPIQYVKVRQQAVPETLDLAARVQPDPTKVVRIFPPASGRVIEIEVKPGDRVRRGQVVASLSSSDVAAALSDFAKANIEAERATQAMERMKELFEHGAAAEKDYIDARAQAETARAELARAKERLELLNANPTAATDRVALLSPARGIVLDISAAPGEFSKSLDSANPLITVADLDTVWVVGDVYEKDIAKVQRGVPATISIEAYPGRRWKGRIDSVAGALDSITRTLKVRVTLPNPDLRLKPEMFGTIHVVAGARQALVVPAAAIIREGATTTVFVKDAGKPQQRTVTVGQIVDGTVEILSGLQPGDEIAAEGAELLKGGPSE